MKIHLGLTILSIGAGLALGLASYEWMAVLLAIGMVACAELFNTVAESLANLVAPEHSVSVQRIKDLAAGAVLLAAGAAVAVAFLIYPEKILLLLGVNLWPFTG